MLHLAVPNHFVTTQRGSTTSKTDTFSPPLAIEHMHTALRTLAATHSPIAAIMGGMLVLRTHLSSSFTCSLCIYRVFVNLGRIESRISIMSTSFTHSHHLRFLFFIDFITFMSQVHEMRVQLSQAPSRSGMVFNSYLLLFLSPSASLSNLSPLMFPLLNSPISASK